jgi:3-hydroxyacyl-CoA dehydrogenase
VNRIAASVSAPGRVAGMHFFSPAHVMRLVEVVRADATSPPTLATVLDLSQRLGKIGVVVGVGDGFVGNRMLYAYRRQADFLLEEGALPEQVDRALRDFGFPMGPFEMNDLAGLDISWRIRKRQAAHRPPGLRYSPIADRLCERGRFGQKTGAGWYRYEPGRRDPRPDPEVAALIEGVSRELAIERRPVADAEVVERCLSALVNEGFRTLDEGLAARPGDIDVIWVHGYGFPRVRGGPMFHAEEAMGLARVLEVVERLHREQGALVQPSETLRRRVAST